MPNIKPISDLRNYTEVLKEVGFNKPVYLTRNGRDEHIIMKPQELDQLQAKAQLFAGLQEGEKSAGKGGWVSADEVDAALGL